MLKYIGIIKGSEKFWMEMPHVLYYEFLTRSFFKQQSLYDEEIRVKRESTGNLTREDESVLYDRRLAMNDVLIYAALSLEAYINYYSKKYEIPFHKDLEKTSSINKYKIFIQIKTGKSISHESIKLIKSIFWHRNEIVHPKPHKIKVGSKPGSEAVPIQQKIETMNLGKLIQELNIVYKEIFELDNDEKVIYEQNPWLLDLKQRR
jgi:hypothetical protein